jgi:hypothetical protein
MRKIVLRNLPPELARAIKRKALNDDVSREDAVIAMIREAEFQRMVEHDVAIMYERESNEPF